LFAAAGGFVNPIDRSEIGLFACESAHSSIPKAASVIGVPKASTISVPADDQGHMDPEALQRAIATHGRRHNIVVATLGSTLHGAVDDIPAIAKICAKYGAWFHVDAVFGGNLAFSHTHRHFLRGLSHADSVSVAPQKWLYVPRLSAIVLILRPRAFDPGLEWPMPYSVSDDRHRGRWGLQASRRADAVTLWVFLQLVGAERVGAWVDGSIALARHFYDMLEQHTDTFPIHKPDLALQLFRIGSPEGANERARKLQQQLALDGRYWLSLATWREETVVRAALVNRATRVEHLTELLDLLGAYAHS
jgi:L-2,4-diaminobutyrate decarboxylase